MFHEDPVLLGIPTLEEMGFDPKFWFPYSIFWTGAFVVLVGDVPFNIWVKIYFVYFNLS